MNLPIRWRYKLEKWRDAVASSFRPEPKPARPRLCPACGTLVGATARRCHECGASLSFSLAAASRSLSSLMPAQSPATYIITGLNFLLFIVSLIGTMQLSGQLNLMGGISGQVSARLGASLPFPYLIESNQWWRLVTAVFLHGGLLHIFMNTWVLMDVGPQVEELYGSARYLFLYILTGAAGFAMSSFTGHFSVGASGALMGLIGAMIAVTTRRGGAYMQMIRAQLVRWVVYILVIGIIAPGIDNAAHLGGLAAGFLIGRGMADREPVTASERKHAYALGWISGIVVAVCFAFMLRFYFQTAGQPIR